MTAKMTISVPDEVAAAARRYAEAHPDSSVSGYFTEAAVRFQRSEAERLYRTWRAGNGPDADEDRSDVMALRAAAASTTAAAPAGWADEQYGTAS